METIRFFDETPRLLGIQGDTFPEMRVVTDADDLTGCSMVLVLENMQVPGSVALTKSCTAFEEEVGEDTVLGFTVQLDSTDTSALCGTYRVHFVLTDAQDLVHRKLIGTLNVLASPGEVS